MGRNRIGTGRKVRVPDDVLADLHVIAAHRGQTVSEVMRDALADYVRRVLNKKRPAA